MTRITTAPYLNGLSKKITPKKKGIYSDVVKVTPDLAEMILEHYNPKNRAVSAKTVNYYAKQMVEGFWQMNGEAIIMDSAGNLADGQHRLHAIIKSGVTLQMLFVFNVPEDSKTTIDTGKKRNLADLISFEVETKNNSLLASVVKTAYLFESGTRGGIFRARLPHSVALDYLGKNEEIIKFVESAQALRNTGDKNVPANVFCVAYWLIAGVATPGDVDVFFTRLATGLGISSPTDPVYILRRLFQNIKNGVHNRKGMRKADQLQAIIQVWNKTITGGEMKMIKIGKEFPEILQ